MYEFIQWFFDGLGTAIIGLVVGAIGGGTVGFRIGKRKNKFVQSQTAGNGSQQRQEGQISANKRKTAKGVDIKSSFHQTQKAGDNAKQTQIGGQDDG